MFSFEHLYARALSLCSCYWFICRDSLILALYDNEESQVAVAYSHVIIPENKFSGIIAAKGISTGLFCDYWCILNPMLNMLTYCFFYKFLLLRAIIQPGCGNYLQEDLDGLHKWSHDWSMDFNRIKYKVTHISKKKISSATNRTIHLTIENLKAFHTTPTQVSSCQTTCPGIGT